MPAIIVGERDGQIANEEQHGIGMFAQSVEQVEGNRLFASTALADRLVRRKIEAFVFTVWRGTSNPTSKPKRAISAHTQHRRADSTRISDMNIRRDTRCKSR